MKKTSKKLEPVLLFKDNAKIKREKEQLQHMVNDSQVVYDLFKALDVEITPQEIHDFLHGGKPRIASTYIHNFVADRIIEKTGSPNFGGVPIKREKLREMIEIPDISHICSKLNEIETTYSHNNQNLKSFKHALIQIKDNKVVPADGAENEIESNNTYYTQNDRGHEVAGKLMEFMQKAKEFSDYLGHNKAGHPLVPLTDFVIPGLQVIKQELPENEHWNAYDKANGNHLRITHKAVGYKISLGFIRKQEADFPDYQIK